MMPRAQLIVMQVAVAVVGLLLWYMLSTYSLFGHIVLPPFFFSNPVDVAAQVVTWFATGVIWKHLWVTLEESILAFVIGSFGGVLVGFWFARQPRTAAVFDPYVKMVNALPRVVLAPIFTLWLGLGIWSKVALGITLVFFIVFFNPAERRNYLPTSSGCTSPQGGEGPARSAEGEVARLAHQSIPFLSVVSGVGPSPRPARPGAIAWAPDPAAALRPLRFSEIVCAAAPGIDPGEKCRASPYVKYS